MNTFALRLLNFLECNSPPTVTAPTPVPTPTTLLFIPFTLCLCHYFSSTAPPISTASSPTFTHTVASFTAFTSASLTPPGALNLLLSALFPLLFFPCNPSAAPHKGVVNTLWLVRNFCSTAEDRGVSGIKSNIACLSRASSWLRQHIGLTYPTSSVLPAFLLLLVLIYFVCSSASCCICYSYAYCT